MENKVDMRRIKIPRELKFNFRQVSERYLIDENIVITLMESLNKKKVKTIFGMNFMAGFVE